MRTKLQIIAFAVSLVFVFRSQAQTGDAIFPKGDLSTVKNHTGNIWLNELNVGDSTFDPSIAVATYGVAAKLDWHVHPGGQVLVLLIPERLRQFYAEVMMRITERDSTCAAEAT
ncbi:hypothetical protein [Tunturiibacter gelidiferens]|uniref:hypothetical protein n=1 Tax=Tunturiibacter gelidiferens TaxID=3069689 RepID=UPI003D9AC5B0